MPADRLGGGSLFSNLLIRPRQKVWATPPRRAHAYTYTHTHVHAGVRHTVVARGGGGGRRAAANVYRRNRHHRRTAAPGTTVDDCGGGGGETAATERRAVAATAAPVHRPPTTDDCGVGDGDDNDCAAGAGNQRRPYTRSVSQSVSVRRAFTVCMRVCCTDTRSPVRSRNLRSRYIALASHSRSPTSGHLLPTDFRAKIIFHFLRLTLSDAPRVIYYNIFIWCYDDNMTTVC